MKSHITDDFLKVYRRLPNGIRTQARKAYRLFQENPQHPSLQFKRIHSTKPYFSARINLGYRTLGVLEDGTIIWFWIGSHSEYDRLISQL